MSAHGPRKRLPALMRIFRKRQTETWQSDPYIPTDFTGWDESSDADLVRFLHQELNRVTTLRASHWVMNEVWYQDVCNLKDRWGHPYWHLYATPEERAELSRHLLGIPVVVRQDAGAPTLIPHSIEVG